MQAHQEKLPTDLIHDRIVNTFEAAAFVGFSQSHFRALVRTGRAPAPLRLSTRKLGWRISTLREWVAAKEAAA